MGDMVEEKARASAWFRELRDEIVSAFEGLEDRAADGAAGRFDVSETRRASPDGSDAGGGLMSVMRGGSVFEKVGVNVSTVYGTLGERAQEAMAARKDLPGVKEDPRFWASGISLVAHMTSPKMSAVHMNTRMFWTPGGWWFGGGSDLNPAIEFEEDTTHFHGVLKEACDRHGEDLYPRFKAWRARCGRHVLRRLLDRGLGGRLRVHAGRRPRLPARNHADLGADASTWMER
jgi:coproporphyrinogen III oxidase